MESVSELVRSICAQFRLRGVMLESYIIRAFQAQFQAAHHENAYSLGQVWQSQRPNLGLLRFCAKALVSARVCYFGFSANFLWFAA